MKSIQHEILYDPIFQEIIYDDSKDNMLDKNNYFAIDISFLPGVTDNKANSLEDALAILNIESNVASGKLILINTEKSESQIKQTIYNNIANQLIENVKVFSIKNLIKLDRFNNCKILTPHIEKNNTVQVIDLNKSERELLELSNNKCLALNIEEFNHIKCHYNRKTLIEKRQRLGLPTQPTDIELEIIAQSWSEHCKHKIFAADINFIDEQLNISTKVQSLYKTFIKDTTNKIRAKKETDWAQSVFSDNAGIVRFDPYIDLCIKVETHNSPSALDPYGGALTGILGVNRDILGCGIGAKPIANTDVFCLADPRDEELNENKKLPPGLLTPRRILTGVHQGVEDGGNKSGIPTVNGAFYFDIDFAGKPLVFVGTIGVLPQKINNNPTSLKTINIGDRVIMAGGAIGRDGIHGATFSSMELNENSPTSAVQIGDPITQKRLSDFLLEARDLGLYTCITDNGAGGLSSSVGEMALISNGAEIDLSLCPIKYPGLVPYELMISESQERMTFAVNPTKVKEFLNLAVKRGVQATDIGEFNDSGNLSIKYNKELVALIDLDFLHNSLPPMQLNSYWDGPSEREEWISKKQKVELDLTNINHEKILTTILSSPNISSKESLVRRYDHEVQSATHIKPFVGTTQQGPSDSGVIWLYPHGGSKDSAISIGCGLNPRLSLYDPYLMAQASVDEAIRNVVVTGGDLEYLCLLDNFCWPDPLEDSKTERGDYKLGQLVRACQGLSDICSDYSTPLVSGKDSMKNDYSGKSYDNQNIKISILPTLLVTAMSKCNINHTVTSDFKNAGDYIYLIGKNSLGLFGSELVENFELNSQEASFPPAINTSLNYQLYKQYHQAVKSNLIKSAHDISDGGLSVALCESMIGGDLGANINLLMDKNTFINLLYSEATGRFLISVDQNDKEKFEKYFPQTEIILLGKVSTSKSLQIKNNSKIEMNISLQDIKNSWSKELV